MDARLLARPATCAKTIVDGGSKGSSQPALNDMKRCNSILMQQNKLISKLQDHQGKRSTNTSVQRKNLVQQKHLFDQQNMHIGEDGDTEPAT